MLPGPRSTFVPSGILILDSSSSLATTDMGRKLGALFLGGGGRSRVRIKHSMLPGTRPTFVPTGILILDPSTPFGYNKHGPKSGGCIPFQGEHGRSPSNTMWPGPKPIVKLKGQTFAARVIIPSTRSLYALLHYTDLIEILQQLSVIITPSSRSSFVDSTTLFIYN